MGNVCLSTEIWNSEAKVRKERGGEGYQRGSRLLSKESGEREIHKSIPK
jgi:hypothetical protein